MLIKPLYVLLFAETGAVRPSQADLSQRGHVAPLLLHARQRRLRARAATASVTLN